MLKKLITGILALAMCASTLAALPQGPALRSRTPRQSLWWTRRTPRRPLSRGNPKNRNVRPSAQVNSQQIQILL